MQRYASFGIGLVLLLLASIGTSRAELIPSSPVTPLHFIWVGNYYTTAALYAECRRIAVQFHLEPTVCGEEPAYEEPDSYSYIQGGWFHDPTSGYGPEARFVLFNAYACRLDGSFRYFEDATRCERVTRIIPPATPKANGLPCASNPQANQPTCGNPISISSGNKVQVEVDYQSAVPLMPLSITRTYNSNPYQVSQDKPGLFGIGWSSELDRRVILASQKGEFNCFTRPDKRPYCEYTTVPGHAIVRVKRPDGRVFVFERAEQGWRSDGDVDDKLESNGDNDPSQTGWKYHTAAGVTEYYDANGLLVSVANRDGITHRITYSTGTSNDSSASRYPNDAPICRNVQDGAPVRAGLPLCLTDHWNRQIQFEFDNNSRVVGMLDPAGNKFRYAYDGESAGCAQSDPGTLACSANNLTSLGYPDGTVRIYHYNESIYINKGGWCNLPGVRIVGDGYGHLLNALTGITDENGSRYAMWGYDEDDVESCHNRYGNGLRGDAFKSMLRGCLQHAQTRRDRCYRGEPDLDPWMDDRSGIPTLGRRNK